MDEHEPIVPEAIHLHQPGYTEGHWDYPRRCANVELALADTRTRIKEWDREADPHGWWHERPQLIALYNEVLRLRAELAGGAGHG